MKVLYKTVMFLTLLIFCVGSVCAAEPDNSTIDNYNSTQDFKDIRVLIDNLEKNDANQANEIQKLKDNNTQLDKRVKALENSSADKDVRINELNNIVNNQSVIINSLKDDNKVLTDRVQALEYSKLTQSNRIKSLEIDIKNLDESNKQLINSNKVLNNTVNNQAVKINNQSVIISELNNKLELQFIEINKLQGDKDKLNAEIKQLNAEKCSIYEKFLSSPKKEDYEQLKKDITNKDNLINELNTKIDNLNKEIKTLRAIYSVSRDDVVNSLKGLSSTKNIQCGQYTFKLDDYLKIPLIKNGKNDIVKFKKDNGRLPKYVMIAGYKVPQKVYKKIYNL